MAEQFGVDAAKRARAGTKVTALVARVETISAKATSAVVPAISWGLIGQPVAWTIYRSMMDDFADFMTDLAEGVEQAGKHLSDSAETYRGVDTAINEVRPDPPAGGGHMSTGDAMVDGGRNAGAAGRTLANSYNGENFGDAAVAGLPSPVTSGIKVIKVFTGENTDPAALAVDASSFNTSCGSTAAAIASDPLNWLIGQGLGFLMSVCTPLKQAIDLVSGNPDALSEAATRFDEVGKDIEALNKDMIAVLDGELAAWHGTAADAARERLGRFAGGVDGVAGKAGDITRMLQICSMVMTVIEEFIKGLLADLVEWLIVTWVAALATAPVTLGGSTAAASGVTAVKAGQTSAQATQKVSRLARLLNKIKEFIAKIQGFLKSAPAKFMEKRGSEAWAELGGGRAGRDEAAAAGRDHRVREEAGSQADRPWLPGRRGRDADDQARRPGAPRPGEGPRQGEGLRRGRREGRGLRRARRGQVGRQRLRRPGPLSR